MDSKPSMASSGSSRITWERCPRCGAPAAIGWRADAETHPALPPVEYAVEFDCAAGCGLSIEEMAGSFQSSVTARIRHLLDPHVQAHAPTPDAHVAAEPDPPGPTAVVAERPSVGDAAARRVRALELMPGHPETAAEVWLWHGKVPEISHDPRLWVTLRSDDWPMWPSTARRLAAALLAAAAIADGSPPRMRW